MSRYVYPVLALLLAGVWVAGCTPRTGEDVGAPIRLAPKPRLQPPPLPEKETASQATGVKLTIVEPQDGEVYETEDGTVRVKLALENYEIMEGGQHLHVILDNDAYQAHYDLNKPCVFENVKEGWHCLRVFPSRPWHESIKPQFSPEAFQMVEFFVVPKVQVHFDPEEPLLTYSRPKGVYEGRDAKRILLDFQVLNCELSEDGYRVRYQVVPAEEKPEQGQEETASQGPPEEAEGREEETAQEESKGGETAREEGEDEEADDQEESRDEETDDREEEDGWTYVSSWPPAAGEKLHVLENLTSGAWTVILELVDKNDKLVSANEWNHTERTITVK